jgi:hypothetical protein
VNGRPEVEPLAISWREWLSGTSAALGLFFTIVAEIAWARAWKHFNPGASLIAPEALTIPLVGLAHTVLVAVVFQRRRWADWTWIALTLLVFLPAYYLISNFRPYVHNLSGLSTFAYFLFRALFIVDLILAIYLLVPKFWTRT